MRSDDPSRFDAIIIGGSFAGLSAAMQLARANRSVCVIDNGTPRNRFAAASHGFFGQDGMPPGEMIATARAKVEAYPSVRFVNGVAAQAEREDGGFFVTLSNGLGLAARKLVLAFGLKDSLPDIAGLQDRWGKTALHCPYCHGFEFLGRPLGVLSTMPGSVHQAQLIPEWGPTTFFLNGGNMPDDETCARLAERKVIIEPGIIVALEGPSPNLDGVRLADGRLVSIAALYLAPRSGFQSEIAGQLGCAMEDGLLGPVITTTLVKATSVPGVFAAGDITRSMHNATLASADGVMAGVGVHQSLVFASAAAA